MFNKVCNAEKLHEDWKKSVIAAIFKKKGISIDCVNYRGISLLTVRGKLFMRVLLSRVKPVLESKVREEQAGFSRIIEKIWEYGLLT